MPFHWYAMAAAVGVIGIAGVTYPIAIAASAQVGGVFVLLDVFLSIWGLRVSFEMFRKRIGVLKDLRVVASLWLLNAAYPFCVGLNRGARPPLQRLAIAFSLAVTLALLVRRYTKNPRLIERLEAMQPPEGAASN